MCRGSPLDMLAQEREDDLRTLQTWIRYAAALQPDATRLPAERCQVQAQAWPGQQSPAALLPLA